MNEHELLPVTAEALAASWFDERASVRARQGTGGRGAWLLFETGDSRYEFEVEVKRQVNMADAARFGDDRDEAGRHRRLLVTEHVQPAVAEALRKRRINYADAAGNCHIEHPPLFLHVEGRKQKRMKETDPIRAFKGEGLKVTFALLLQPALASRPYRDLAGLSGASHGVVQYTIGDLDRLDFIARLSRTQRRLHHLPELLDRWATGYAEVLRPKLSMGTFRFVGEDHSKHWRDLKLDPKHERWGGEPAAALATAYLKPARLTVYSRDTRTTAMKRLRVVPDADGAVEIVQMFWPQRLEEELADQFNDAAVPDVLAYADLLSTSDPRNADVAARLRERIVEGTGRG